MKKKCIICVQAKGKRACIQYDKALICPKCCAEMRNPSCESCSYYMTSQKYEMDKFRRSRDKSFTFEFNEEVDKAVGEALAMIERRKLEKAEARLAELLSEYPDYHMVQYGMGALYAFKGQLDAAITYFKNAVDIFPYLAEAHYNLGVAYKKKVDIPNMVKYLEQAILLSDSGAVIHQEARNLLDDVEKIIREQNGTDLKTYVKAQEQFQLAVEFMEKREWEKAIHAFRASERIVNTIPQVYGNLGICHAQLGQKSLSLAAFDNALELDPRYELAMVNKAITQSLKEGEKLNSKIETVEYYKDYSMKNKSYLQQVIEEGFGKPDAKM